MRTLLLLLAIAGALQADVLVLKDGRRMAGKVVDKPAHYEVTTEAGLKTFLKDEVERVITSPKEILGDAEKLFDEAKQEFTQALGITNAAEQNAKLKEAIVKITKARESYASARELFWEDKYSDLDLKLVQIMQLMRLLRERVGSEIARRPDAPAAPPRPPPPPPPAASAPAAPPAPPGIVEAFGILVDASQRSDGGRRAAARDALRAGRSGFEGGYDLATAAMTFLSRTDAEWKLDAAGAKALQEYFDKWLKEPQKLTPAAHLDAARQLGEKVAALKKGDATEALALFAMGHLGHVVPGPDADKAAQSVGLVTKGGLAGTPEGHAVRDLGDWLATGDFDLAALAYAKEFRTAADTSVVRFLAGYALLRQVQIRKRGFERSVVALDSVRPMEAPFRDHVGALAKSVKTVAVCSYCAGEARVRCTNCHGRKEVRFDCARCKGVGAVTGPGGGLASCGPCKGRGFDKLLKCDKCKDGFPECRVCDRKPRTPPELEDIFMAQPCGPCETRGVVFRRVMVPCRSCMGLGQKLTPRADPSKILP